MKGDREGNPRLDAAVKALRGMTGATMAAVRQLGIETVKDLFFYFPFRYERYVPAESISDLREGVDQLIVLTLERVRPVRSFRRRLSMTEAAFTDGEEAIMALWFNQPYLVKTLVPGERYRLAGRIKRTKFGMRFVTPLYAREAAEDASETVASVMPVYPLTTGVSQHVLRKLLRANRGLIREVEDPLPAAFRSRYGLLPLARAVEDLHFPDQDRGTDDARRRIGFDELLRIQLAVGRTRTLRERASARAVPFDEAGVKRFVDGLPFRLTDDQRKAAWEIVQDMGKRVPMQRLLDGDVGSGKTAVAAVGMFLAASAGRQAALMAPTEILARQHFETLTEFFAGERIPVILWTSAYKRSATGGAVETAVGKAAVTELADRMAAGGPAVVVGTHALVQGSVRFGDLALAVVDEQHRFGVAARQALRESGKGTEPHFLSMTATPIPRSLALTAFGDLDLSLLRVRPEGRRPVVTRLVPPGRREKAYEAIRARISEGRQAFVVCPLIDPSDKLGVQSATATHKELSRKVFPDASVGMLHGKMSASEKEEVMREVGEGRIDILVSTSVIEVGVDIPNATVMCILGAERFGLAQLHQFRGRIGRGGHDSECFLMPTEMGDGVKERLDAVVHHSDGFVLAEKDLELRGPGTFFGTEQTGFPELRVADLADMGLVKDARRAAAEILAADPDLRGHPALRRDIERSVQGAHLE